MVNWVATSYGALDMRGWGAAENDIEIVLIPVFPSEPIGLSGAPAGLWRRLLGDGATEEDLSSEERELVREFAEAGIASSDLLHKSRHLELTKPWLGSPFHELVYSLVESVARERQICTVFIKGPVLHLQGLRERKHSGDVDVWVDPCRIRELQAALTEWGWSLRHHLWEDTEVPHSVTMRRSSWGCEIDLHRRFPGIGLADTAAFGVISSHLDSVAFAGVAARVPSRALNAVISALHILRPQYNAPLQPKQVDEAALVLSSAGDGAAHIADELNAVGSLRRSFFLAFPDSRASEGKPPDHWIWREKGLKVKYHLAGLRETPLRQWPAALSALLWPSEALARESEDYAGTRNPTLFRARLARVKRGLRSLRHR